MPWLAPPNPETNGASPSGSESLAKTLMVTGVSSSTTATSSTATGGRLVSVTVHVKVAWPLLTGEPLSVAVTVTENGDPAWAV